MISFWKEIYRSVPPMEPACQYAVMWRIFTEENIYFTCFL